MTCLCVYVLVCMCNLLHTLDITGSLKLIYCQIFIFFNSQSNSTQMYYHYSIILCWTVCEKLVFLYCSPAAVSSSGHRVSLLPQPEPERCGSMWPVGPVYVDEPRGRTEGLTPADSPALSQTSFSLTGQVAHSSLWIYYWTQEPLGCAIWLLKKPVEIIHQKGSLVLLLLLLLLFVHFAVFYANFTTFFKSFRWKKNLQML